jgi:hypothetical protein
MHVPAQLCGVKRSEWNIKRSITLINPFLTSAALWAQACGTNLQDKSDSDVKVMLEGLTSLPSLHTIAVEISRSIWWKYELQGGSWMATEKAFRVWKANPGQTPSWTWVVDMRPEGKG